MSTELQVEGLDDVRPSKAQVTFYEPTTSSKTTGKTSNKVDLENLDRDLLERIRLAEQDWLANKTLNPKGEPFPITSAARTRDIQQNIYDRWRAGEENIFMPTNPAAFPNQQMFHTNAVDIPPTVPNSFLATYGLHRPFGDKDIVHVEINPKVKWEKPLSSAELTDTGDIVIPGLGDIKPVAEEVPTGAFYGNPLLARQGERSRATLGGKPGATEKLVTDIAKPLQEMSFEDWYKKSLLGPALTYSAALPMSLVGDKKWDELRKESGEILTKKGENLLSGIAKFAESPIETTKNVASTIANTPIGTLIGEGIKGTVYDPEMLLLGGPAQKVGEKAISGVEKIGRVTEKLSPEKVKLFAAKVAENAGKVENRLDRWNDAFNARRVAAYEKGLINEKGMPNVGAAMTPDAATVKATLSLASPDIQQLYGNLPHTKINVEALNRHTIADKFGINLTKGQATQDPALMGREWNLRGTSPELMARLNERNPKLYEGLNNIRDRAAPDIYDFDIRSLGQNVIDDILAKDKIRTTNIANAYKRLEDANGGQFPIDAVKLGQNINTELGKKLKTAYYEEDLRNIKRDIDRFVNNKTMTFEDFENLRTNLAEEMRSNKNGNVRAAAGIIRNELEKLPMPENLKGIKPLADEARRLVVERSNVLKTNPAYRAAVKDTRDLTELSQGLEHVGSDKFIDKFITGNTDTASRANIKRLINEVGADSKAAQSIRAGTIEKLRNGSAQLRPEDVFREKGYRNFLDKNLGSKADSIWDADTIRDLRELGDLASWTEHVGGTKTANASNTATAIMQEFGVPAIRGVARAKTQGLSDIAEFALGGIKKKFEVKDILKRGAGIEKD